MPSSEAPVIHEIATPTVALAVVPAISTGRPLAKLAKGRTAVAAEPEDNGAWLQQAVDTADRLGILACKPVITSDRRQRAFALYTLYMGLKDLRAEVDHRAKDLNSAMEGIAGGNQPSEFEMKKLAKLGHSYEKAMSAILQWDCEATKTVIKSYTAELQSMDEIRSMLAFLSDMKRTPKVTMDLRTISGMDETED
jgi:hypothetical protein